MFPKGIPPLSIFPFQKGSKMHLLKEGVNIKQLQRMFLKLPENWPPKRLDKKGCYETYVEC